METAYPKEMLEASDDWLGEQMPSTSVESDRPRAYLLSGEFHASAQPCEINTILGSGVSICLWDKRRSAGGMNHFLLPASREGEPASLRFADIATRALLERLRALGCRPPNLRARIFGGAAILQARNRYAASLGAQNVAAAVSLMRDAGIPVIAQQTGAAQARKIIFNTDDGVAWAWKI